MAMGILEKLAFERGHTDWQISSAGLSAFAGAPATAHAVEVAREQGVDISHHEARRFDLADANECDLILVLSGEHFDYVSAWGAEVAARTYLLKHFPEPGNPGAATWVRDPIGGELDDYRRTFLELDEIVRRILPELSRRAGKAK